jgi:toxin ParE1/3/4
MRVRWLPAALRNRAHQLAYIAEESPRAAVEIGDAIEAAIMQLADFPRLGRIGRVDGTREFVIGGTPYLIIYREEVSEILILRLLHGAQRWPPTS